MALLLTIDSIDLARPKPGIPHGGGWLEQYVNDRPYVASSHLSVAIASVLGSALAGTSKERPELAERAIPLEARVPVVPSREGAELIRELFEPLGYTVDIQGHPLDGRFPEWGASPYFSLRLTSTSRLRDLLAHLYVLLPVLDDDKHYWVGDDEVGKLLRFGEGWLGSHPQRDLISRRYLKHQRGLVRQALAQLLDAGQSDPGITEAQHGKEEEQLEAPLRLGEQRMQAVLATLRTLNTTKVLDLGCGEGTHAGRVPPWFLTPILPSWILCPRVGWTPSIIPYDVMNRGFGDGVFALGQGTRHRHQFRSGEGPPYEPLPAAKIRMHRSVPLKPTLHTTLDPYPKVAAESAQPTDSTAVATETSRKLSGLPSKAMPEPQRTAPIIGRHNNIAGHHRLPSKAGVMHILAATTNPRTISGISSTVSSISPWSTANWSSRESRAVRVTMATVTTTVEAPSSRKRRLAQTSGLRQAGPTGPTRSGISV